MVALNGRGRIVFCIALALLILPGAVQAQSFSVLMAPRDLSLSCAEALVANAAAAGAPKDILSLFPRPDQATEALATDSVGQKVLVMPLVWITRQRNHRVAITTEPFVFRDQGHFFAFTNGDLMAEMAEDLARTHRIRILALALGTQFFVVSKEAIAAPGDFANRRIAVTPDRATWFSPLGSTGMPVINNAGSLMEQGMSGGVDAALVPLQFFDFAPLERAFRFIQQHPTAMSPIAFAMSEARFGALAPPERMRLQAAAQAAALHCSSQSFDRDAALFRGFAAKGVTVVASKDTDAIASTVLRGRMAVPGVRPWSADDLQRLATIR